MHDAAAVVAHRIAADDLRVISRIETSWNKTSYP
jgi:hypothetical protein